MSPSLAELGTTSPRLIIVSVFRPSSNSKRTSSINCRIRWSPIPPGRISSSLASSFGSGTLVGSNCLPSSTTMILHSPGSTMQVTCIVPMFSPPYACSMMLVQASSTAIWQWKISDSFSPAAAAASPTKLVMVGILAYRPPTVRWRTSGMGGCLSACKGQRGLEAAGRINLIIVDLEDRVATCQLQPLGHALGGRAQPDITTGRLRPLQCRDQFPQAGAAHVVYL